MPAASTRTRTRLKRPNKHPDELVDRRETRVLKVTKVDVSEFINEKGELVVPASPGTELMSELGLPIPAPPDDVGEYGIERWNRFWRSPQSLLVDNEAAHEAIEHWCRLIDNRRDLWREYINEPVIEGIRRGMITNPLFGQVMAMDRVILQYENHFGMTPLAQLRLGIDFLTISKLKRENDKAETKGQKMQPTRKSDVDDGLEDVEDDDDAA